MYTSYLVLFHLRIKSIYIYIYPDTRLQRLGSVCSWCLRDSEQDTAADYPLVRYNSRSGEISAHPLNQSSSQLYLLHLRDSDRETERENHEKQFSSIYAHEKIICDKI